MRARVLFALLLCVSLMTFAVQPAFADGIVIPGPCEGTSCPVNPQSMDQLVIRYHQVDVRIENQIAVTKVDQVFFNPNDWPVEGTYIFPLPADAAVSDFRLWIDNEPVKGEVLSAEQARQKYEEIVRSLRDPALLEYIGQGAVQASVFPIQPGEERRIQLEYSQVLTSESGLVRYIYPLSTEKFSAQPLENVTVRVDVISGEPVRAVYSPSHPVVIDRLGDRRFSATYEASNVTPDQDFGLYYSIGESQAFHLFTYRDPQAEDPDGFFMLMLAPRPDAAAQAVSKDLLLVLDRSGSMEGEKFQQAQQALRFILNHLNPGDRFYLLSFSSEMQAYAQDLRPASEAQDAVRWVDQLGAAGSTDINRALLETAAIADAERPTYLIFLTDGLPTEGVVESSEILNNYRSTASENLRLFSFGVGYDVDTFLLDSLAQEHHGLSTYVQPGEPLDEVLSAFYARISTPVLTDLSLEFGALSVYDLYPNPLPDLFAGSQVVISGRYRAGGETDVVVSGKVNGQMQSFRYSNQMFDPETTSSSASLSGLSRLWATRKIGYLLRQIRLNGPDQETIDQIVALSIRYGIVTPYTSYLVTEPMPLGAEQQERLSQDAFGAAVAAPTIVSGRAAVEKAAGEGALSSADQAAGVPSEADQSVRIVGSRTFVFAEGVWTDTVFDPDNMATIKVPFLSDDYFRLVNSRLDIAAAFALGQRVIFVVDRTAYEVVAENAQGDLIIISETPRSTEPKPSLPSIPEQPGVTDEPVVPVNQPEKPAPAATGLPCAGVVLPLLTVGLILVRRRN